MKGLASRLGALEAAQQQRAAGSDEPTDEGSPLPPHLR